MNSIKIGPWSLARERYLKTLTDEEKSLFTHASLENVFYSASAAQKNHEENSRSRALVKRLKLFVEAISEYGAALDVYSNASPEIMCPLWGSIRVLLHVASEFDKYFEKLIDMFASIGDVLPTFRVYQQLFAGHHFLLQALSEVYLDIIKFCMNAKQVFNKLKENRGAIALHIKILWKPFHKQFGGVLDDFRKHRRNVERQASLSHMIEAAGEREAQSNERTRAQLQRATDNDIQKELKRRHILNNLSSIDHKSRHLFLRKKRYENTRNWVFGTAQYMEWFGKDESCCLWCYGIPGSGKTIITTTVVDALLASSVPKGPTVIYFYCDYSDKRTVEFPVIIGSFIKQLLLQIDMPDHIQSKLETTFQFGFRHPDIDELLEILLLVLKLFNRVFIILDGIDECGSNSRVDLLAGIRLIVGSSPITVKLFLASRAEVDFKRVFGKYICLPISVENITSDIVSFVDGIVQAKIVSGDLVVQNPALVREIVDALVKGAQGMFIWVSFQIDDICEEMSDTGIRRALRSLPEGLTETYTRALQKIRKRSTMHTAQQIFKWMVCAKRPLSMDEIQEAISISPLDRYLEPENIITDDSKVIGACANLVVFDNDEKVVRFAHHSVQEFILSDPKDESVANFHFRFTDAEHEVAEICVTYLSFRQFETQVAKQSLKGGQAALFNLGFLGPGSLFKESYMGWVGKLVYGGWMRFRGVKPRMSVNWNEYLMHTRVPPPQHFEQQYCLLGYVIDNWALHTIGLSDANTKLWALFRDLALERNLPFSFRPWGEISGAKDLPYMSMVLWALDAGHGPLLGLLEENPRTLGLGSYLDQEVEGEQLPLRFVALQRSVQKGQQTIVELLLKSGADPDTINLSGDSLLNIAAQGGHETVVKLLLDYGADLDEDGKFEGGPLHQASLGGHDGLVKFLLESGVHPNLTNKSKDTPLHQAASKGHETVVRLLLKSNADPNGVNKLGNTVLHEAANGGHDAVVKHLLRNGAEKSARNSNSGDTALISAARKGHYAVAVILLSNGVDYNEVNNSGNTALYEAASGGHHAVVKLLMKSGASGSGELDKASQEGCDAIVKLLLENGVDPNATNGSGNSAIHLAASMGHYAAIQVLLDNGADKYATDSLRNSAIHLAASMGHYGAVQVLLNSKADQHETNAFGNSAIHLAALGGHDAVAKLLLVNGANPNTTGNSGGSAIDLAASGGHDAVVKLCLENGANKLVKDTALQAAASGGHRATVGLLLDNGANQHTPNNSGNRAIHLAASRGHHAVVELLLNKGANQHTPNSSGDRAIHLATLGGHHTVAKLLLDSGTTPDALQLAASRENNTAVKLLLDNGANQSTKDAALHAAASSGHCEIVQLLLDNGANRHVMNSSGNSAIHLAASSGHDAVVKLFLENGVDPNVTNNSGDSAIHLAASSGYHAVVQVLLDNRADKYATDSLGNSAVHLAALGGHNAVVKLCLKNGADPNVTNDSGNGAIHLAASEGHYATVELLIGNGANHYVMNNSGESAMHLAASGGHQAVVQLLLLVID